MLYTYAVIRALKLEYGGNSIILSLRRDPVTSNNCLSAK